MEQIPDILNGLRLRLQFLLIKRLNEAEAVQDLRKIIH